MSIYPPTDVVTEAAAVPSKCRRTSELPRACIAAVEPGSPADDTGFEPGCFVTTVDGVPVRDIIDWRWLAADDVVTLGYIDLDGDAGEVELERAEGESWGFEFEGVVFDGVKQCRNACTFCFMRQLPEHMRPSLTLRDDDFRLSFLAGTFVTFTNITPEDEARIIEQRITPLRVSLHAADAEARRTLIGKHAAHGLAALDRLLAAGIEAHAQIVLVPGVNDGEVLKDTLIWAYEHPGILNIGIVPLGYTKHQSYFDHSFNEPADARAVLATIESFQQRALAERGTPWVFAADEFYRNAYGENLLENLPPTEHYGDFSMFEDGIGIIRSYVDDWNAACESGVAEACASMLRSYNLQVRFVVGEAMQPFLDQLIAQSPLVDVFQALTVRNNFFGGNVDVTGLLCGCDIISAIDDWESSGENRGQCSVAQTVLSSHETSTGRFGSCETRLVSTAPDSRAEEKRTLFVLPSVMFNDDGVTLDDMTLEDMENGADARLAVVSCNATEFLPEITELAERFAV